MPETSITLVFGEGPKLHRKLSGPCKEGAAGWLKYVSFFASLSYVEASRIVGRTQMGFRDCWKNSDGLSAVQFPGSISAADVPLRKSQAASAEVCTAILQRVAS